MNVKDAMTRAPQTVCADETLHRAMRLMQFGGFSHLPVYDGRHLVGMVRWSDIDRFLAQAPDPQTWLAPPLLASAPRVHGVMRYHLVTISEDAPLDEAVRLMLSGEEDCLLVLDGGGQLTGILTRTDALRVLLDRVERMTAPPYLPSQEPTDMTA